MEEWLEIGPENSVLLLPSDFRRAGNNGKINNPFAWKKHGQSAVNVGGAVNKFLLRGKEEERKPLYIFR